MAFTNKTANYELPQWQLTDPFQMDDFNAAFAAIDSGMKENADAIAAAAEGSVRLLFSTYTGNGQSTQDIVLGFAPKAVLVLMDGDTTRIDGYRYGGLAVQGRNATAVYLLDNGFRVYSSGSRATNLSSTTYTYIVFY